MPDFSTWTPEQIATVASALAALIGALAAVASAFFAWLAIRAQRASSRPSIRVRHQTPIPFWGAMPGTLAGADIGEPIFVINIHNNGVLPVTVTSAALLVGSDGSLPFLGAPPGMGDNLPRRLEPGEEATLYLGGIRQIAAAAKDNGGAKRVTATLAGGQSFRGKRMWRTGWLDSWIPKS